MRTSAVWGFLRMVAVVLIGVVIWRAWAWYAAISEMVVLP